MRCILPPTCWARSPSSSVLPSPGWAIAWGDAAAAIGVAVMISVLGLRLARSTVETLLDRAPEGVSEKADAAIRAVPGVVDIERLRVRMVGSTHFIDAIVQVPRTYPIDRVEEIKRKAQAGGQQGARRCRPDLHRGAGRARQ